MPSGDPVSYADAALAQRRIGTYVGDTDLAAASYATQTNVDSLTVTVVAGRVYTVKWIFHLATAVSATTNPLRCRLRAGTSQLTYRDYTATVTTPSEPLILEVDWTAPVSGSQTFNGSIERISGSNNSVVRGATSQPRRLTVDFAYV